MFSLSVCLSPSVSFALHFCLSLYVYMCVFFDLYM